MILDSMSKVTGVALWLVIISLSLSLALPSRADRRSTRSSRAEVEISARNAFAGSGATIVFRVDPELAAPGTVEVTCMAVRSSADSAFARAYLHYPRELRDEARRALQYFSLESRNLSADANEAHFVFGGAIESLDRDLRDRIRFRIELQTPVGAQLRIEAPYFDTDIEGAIGDLVIERTLAPVNVRGARGRLTIGGANARITVSDLVGEFEIETTNERIRLTDVEVSPIITGEPAVGFAQTESANIEFTRYRGVADFQTTRGSLRGRDVELLQGVSRLTNEGGEINVRFSGIEEGARLKANASYERIQLGFPDDLDARLSLSVEDGGSIKVDGIPHRIPEVYRDRLEVVVGAGLADVSVSARNGSDISITRTR